MRKIVSLLLILMMISTSVFAGGGEMLFAGVPGERLTEQELEDAEGDGVVTLLLSGAAFGALTYLADCLSRSQDPTWEGAGRSAVVGAIAAFNPFLGSLAGIGLSGGSSYRVGAYYIRYQ